MLYSFIILCVPAVFFVTVVIYLLNCVQLFCNPMHYSSADTLSNAISQARILEWVVISFCRGFSRSRDWTRVSCLAGDSLPLSHQEAHALSYIKKKKKRKKSNLKTYHKATVIKRVWYWHNSQHTNQGNRTKNSKVEPHIYGQLIFNKGDNIVKRSNSFCKKSCWEN